MSATVDYVDTSAVVTFSSETGSATVEIENFERAASFAHSDARAIREARRLMRDFARGASAGSED